MTAVAVLLWLLVALVAAPVLVVWLQVLLAWPRRGDGLPPATPDGAVADLRCAVLVPAHNEEAVIAETVRGLRAQLRSDDVLLVVADNCSDDTARLAREAGAVVVERVDAVRRGKGYALDFGVHQLAAEQPPDVLIIIDADCSVASTGGLHRLAAEAVRQGRPVQALYLMDAPEGAGLKLRVAAFAWRLRNWVRPLGWWAIGAPCQLMGTGMAFPWVMAQQMQLANAELVEDMKLGVDLALAGTPPLFCPAVLVRSTFPTGEQAVQSQRTRWEHGHLGMIAAHAPRLWARALRHLDGGLCMMALDISVPPLALLVLLLLGVWLLAALVAVLGAGSGAVAAATGGLALMAMAVGMAWWGWGRVVVSGRDLLSVPLYVLGKVPMYLGYVFHRQKDWVKTARVRPGEDVFDGALLNSGGMVSMKIALVAEHASLKFGGEAALPFHYFRILMQRGVDVFLLVHERTRKELLEAFPDAVDKMIFIEDSRANRIFWQIERRLPWRLGYFTAGWLSRISTQLRMRRQLLKMVQAAKINLVHQVIPVSPKEPSFMFGLGAPVVIGPMNGGMRYPDGFVNQRGWLTAFGARLASKAAVALNRLIPGKRQADVILVANERTEKSLAGSRFRKIIHFVENGVDLNVWNKNEKPSDVVGQNACRFVFIGRLIDLKAVDLLIEAFAKLHHLSSSSLTIIGSGPAEGRWMELADAKGLLARNSPSGVLGRVSFVGWKSQAECADILRGSDVLVLPSLMECGGAVVLEAMAMGLPVIATHWGGPADYLDASCGRLVEPVNRDTFIQGLVDAMDELAASPALRKALGARGREKVLASYDWERKVNQMLAIYQQTLRDHGQTR